MQKEIVSLIDSMTKKRDQLNAAISALSHVRSAEAPRRIVARVAPPKRKRHPKMKWTPEHRAKYLSAMAARRAKANGAIAGEGPTPVPETPVV